MKHRKIIVLVKQVPDIEKVKFDVEKGRLDRTSADAVINPFDLNAIEAAVQLKEKYGFTITAISMGPPKAASALQESLARGVDSVILLSDEEFAGSDTLATSFTLSSAIRKLGDFDFVICGEKTVDGDTGQVGPEVAEHLGVPHVAYVHKIVDFMEDKMRVMCMMGRYRYLIEIKSPGLITVTKEVNQPRYLSFSKRLAASRLPVETWKVDELSNGSDLSRFGVSGSPTKVFKAEILREKTKESKIFQGNEAVKNLALAIERSRGE